MLEISYVLKSWLFLLLSIQVITFAHKNPSFIKMLHLSSFLIFSTKIRGVTMIEHNLH